MDDPLQLGVVDWWCVCLSQILIPPIQFIYRKLLTHNKALLRHTVMQSHPRSQPSALLRMDYFSACILTFFKKSFIIFFFSKQKLNHVNSLVSLMKFAFESDQYYSSYSNFHINGGHLGFWMKFDFLICPCHFCDQYSPYIENRIKIEPVVLEL